MGRRLDMGSIELGVGRMIGHSLNTKVGGVDHGRVGWDTGVGQMIGVGSWVFGGGSLRTASIRCPGCQPMPLRL